MNDAAEARRRKHGRIDVSVPLSPLTSIGTPTSLLCRTDCISYMGQSNPVIISAGGI